MTEGSVALNAWHQADPFAPLSRLRRQLVLQLRTALRPQLCLLGCRLAFAYNQLRCLLHGSASKRGATQTSHGECPRNTFAP
ncbi:hypothetical protein BBSC_1601 [Bifidobacterium scardovii JCM 12489 = DSM 13734]|nr:hypothetical protein BBSC_1601 [Bifidobacterium scardovii JCM 12489 = DSM 13734]